MTLEKTPLEALLDENWDMYVSNLDTAIQTLYFQSKTGQKHMVICPWRDKEERLKVLDALSFLLKQENAVRYVMITEAWIIRRSQESPDEIDEMPSEAPDRQSVVTALAVDGDGSGCGLRNAGDHQSHSPRSR